MQTPIPSADIEPLPVLPYSAVAVRSVTRVEDTLTINVPAPSLSRQVFWQAVILMLVAIPAAILDLTFITAVLDPSSAGRGMLCVAPAAGLFTLASVRAIKRLIYLSREGRTPIEVRVWPGGLEMQSPGKLHTINSSLPRDRIRDVYVSSKPAFSGAGAPTLVLQVVVTDGTFCVANIPWQANEPMNEVEDQIRELLSLAPTTHVMAASDQSPAQDSTPPAV